MYGLKQAAILAYKQLKQNLAHHGYHPIPHSVGMWKHKSRKTIFCLCVDDFGIQYHTQADADHLIHALRQYYKITIDWNGRNYCGLQLDWNYKDRHVDISMPGYIDNLLQKLKINVHHGQLMHHTNGANQLTGNHHNITYHKILPQGSLILLHYYCSQSSDHSYTTQEQLTHLCYRD